MRPRETLYESALCSAVIFVCTMGSKSVRIAYAGVSATNGNRPPSLAPRRQQACDHLPRVGYTRVCCFRSLWRRRAHVNDFQVISTLAIRDRHPLPNNESLHQLSVKN